MPGGGDQLITPPLGQQRRSARYRLSRDHEAGRRRRAPDGEGDGDLDCTGLLGVDGDAHQREAVLEQQARPPWVDQQLMLAVAPYHGRWRARRAGRRRGAHRGGERCGEHRAGLLRGKLNRRRGRARRKRLASRDGRQSPDLLSDRRGSVPGRALETRELAIAHERLPYDRPGTRRTAPDHQPLAYSYTRP